MAKFYKVGGAVRDKIMGIPCKDMDYVVEASSFEEMRNEIIAIGGDIFLETPQYLTIRAKVPKYGAADFVLPRADGNYSDGRHPDDVRVGTLLEDLARRDFTCNAIAYNEEDNFHIDPHNGIQDINDKVLRCVGNSWDRFNEDALRLLRAVRFAITKEFKLHDDIRDCFNDEILTNKLGLKISEERKREELHKCFKYDTMQTINYLTKYPLLAKSIFGKNSKLWLMPTSKQ